MDNDLKQLEAELKNLRPAPPSPQLHARIEKCLVPSDMRARSESLERRSQTWWIWAAALPAAAALALILSNGTQRLPTTQTTAVIAAPAEPRPSTAPTESRLFKPVSAENVLYAVSDEGLVTLEDGTAARRERLNYVDTITWKNPRTNASVRWTVPREEVRVVPVKFQ